MDIITVDFESFYDKDYSLSKMTTEAYVNDKRFEVIGVGVKVNGEETKTYSGSKMYIAGVLAGYNWKDSAVLAHNTLFDGSILALRFNIKPKLWLDTLSMARAVHGTEVGGSLKALAEHYGVGEKGSEVMNALGKRRTKFREPELEAYMLYCKNDVDLTYEIFKRMAPAFNKTEANLIDLTLRMHTEPKLLLDDAVLSSHLYMVRKKKEELMAQVATDRKGLMSNPKFAEALIALGVTPPTKISSRTGKEAYAFAKSDEAMKELLEHDNPDVQALVAARIGTKSTLEETRTQRFMDMADRCGKLPVPLKYYGAMTGRWAACLVDDTQVLVYDTAQGVMQKRIVDVLADDLVWDGEEFVTHGGVSFNGYAEVIEWDGVRGTEDHVVFTEVGEITLLEAMQGGHRISIANSPTEDTMGRARALRSSN